MKRIERTSLKNLTPKQKLEFLNEKLNKEKNKEKKNEIKNLITIIKQEQALLRESIRQFESRRPPETTERRQEEPQEKQAEPLEEIIEEEAPPPQETKPTEIYGLGTPRDKYLSPDERKKDEYKFQPDLSRDRFTLEEQQNLINTESQRLEKEKKKYETGVS